MPLSLVIAIYNRRKNTTASNTQYTVPVVMPMRDLGNVVAINSHFNVRLTKMAQLANLICNVLLRWFTIKNKTWICRNAPQKFLF